MDLVFVKSNWAALFALVPITVVAWNATAASMRRSSRGRLSKALKQQRHANLALEDAQKKVAAASAKLEKLSARIATVKPRDIEAARGDLEDCLALEKILGDKCQVTTNHVRRVIFEEFPPTRHQALREKHLPQDVADGRPFSF